MSSETESLTVWEAIVAAMFVVGFWACSVFATVKLIKYAWFF